MHLELHSLSLPWGTFGRLVTPAFDLFTVEQPWVPNPDAPGGKPFESCIPAGLYFLEPHSSDKYPDTWAMVNEGLGVSHYDKRPDVPRFACVIHIANWPRNVQGCIGVGMALVPSFQGHDGVQDSGVAMGKLRDLLSSRRGHTLQVHQRRTL